MKRNLVILISGLFTVALFAFTTKTLNQKPWPVPNAYNTHCKSCHGTKGKGDGPKADQLDTESGDFTLASFQSQTDGSLFYKTSEGRKDMPSYKKKIPDANDIWAVVNYMRTFK